MKSWVFHSLRAPADPRRTFAELKRLTVRVVDWLAHPDTFEVTCEVITDILSNYISFFTPEDESCLAGVIASPWAVERYENLVSGDGEWESLQFGRLLVAFAEATVQRMVRDFSGSHSQTLFRMLHGMVTVPGYPVAEEEVSGATFEFWSSLAEFLLDPQNVGEGELGPITAFGKKEIMQTIEELWRKIQIPPSSQSQIWTKDQREGFMSFRKDVADLVEAAYGILGVELFDRLVSQIRGALSHAETGDLVAWEEIEASLFCLDSLSDCLSDEPEEDSALKVMFGSRLFSMMADFGNHIPLKVRQTAVHMIGLLTYHSCWLAIADLFLKDRTRRFSKDGPISYQPY